MRGVDKEVWVALIGKMPEIINAVGVLTAAIAASVGAIYAARNHTLTKQGNETTALNVALSTVNTTKIDALTETVNKSVVDAAAIAAIAASPPALRPLAVAPKRIIWPPDPDLAEPPEPPGTRRG